MEIEGYSDVDPQATLGGSDGKKDILARRDGAPWIAAVHFPPTDKSFADIRRKFQEDHEGVSRHQAEGFAFFVNEHLTMGERGILVADAGGPTQLYHLERIRHVLDTPKGYGLRLEYLRIPMSLEEQFSYFNERGQHLTEQLVELQRTHAARRVIDSLERTATDLERTMADVAGAIATKPSTIGLPPAELSDRVGAVVTPMAALSIGTLALLHRAITAADATANGGELRAVRVWIGTRDNPTFVPPPPEDVPSDLAELVGRWRRDYAELAKGTDAEKISGLARLHHGVLAIHPFLDGNGRLARLLIDLAAQELLSRRIGSELTSDRAAYFASLRAAQDGNLLPLESLITAALA